MTLPALGLDDTALLALTAGFHVFGHHIAAFHDHFAFLGAYLQYLTGVTAVFAADNHNGVAGFNMNFCHSVKPPYSDSGARLTIFR